MMCLPEDITCQILLCVPVKSRLRLTCVCKTWRCIILSGQFIDSHTQFGRRMEIVLSSRIDFSGYRDFHSSDHMILESDLQSMALSETLQLNDDYSVMGHCNGIICLIWRRTRQTTILLWNPAIRQCRALPQANHYSIEGLQAYRIGFGYDAWNGDYKVVTFSWDHSNLMTYSLKNDAWKSINNSSLKLGCMYSFSNECGLFFKGRLYWICFKFGKLEEHRAYCLLVFDLAKEELLEFDLSDTFIDGNHDITHILGIFRGCISVLIQRRDYGAHSFEIWSMRDHFIPQSWTRVVDRSSMALAVDKGFLASLGCKDNHWRTGLTRDGKLYVELFKDDANYLYLFLIAKGLNSKPTSPSELLRFGENYLALYNVETQKLDVHHRKKYPTITIDWSDTSDFHRNFGTSAHTFRWFAISDFIETLIPVIRKVNPSPAMCLETHQERT